MNVKELINEYGAVTGRSPGWERYLSVADYLLFAKAASEITLERPISFASEPEASVSEQSRTCQVSTHEKPQTLPFPKPSTGVILPHVAKNKQELELELFKSLKE